MSLENNRAGEFDNYVLPKLEKVKFKDGQPNGPWEHFDENGNLLEKRNYDEGTIKKDKDTS